MVRHTHYSPLKIFHQREWIDTIRRDGHAVPIFVEIMPTNRCNQQCNFCSYRSPIGQSTETFDQREEIPITKLLEIVADCRRMGVKAIEVTGGGEPLVHPQAAEFLTAILDAKLKLGLVTNGTRWSDEIEAAALQATWMRFSLDAGTAQTYAQTRKSTQRTYEHVCAVIRRLTAKRIGRDPVIGVGFVVTQDNWSEVYEAATRAKEDGADNFRISACFQTQGIEYFREFRQKAEAMANRVERELADADFTVFNLFNDRLADLFAARPTEAYCGFQRASTLIGADLNVYRCCVLAYTSRGAIGNLKDQSFAEFWSSAECRQKLREFDARTCPRCMFNKKNAAIAYALHETPPHVEFV